MRFVMQRLHGATPESQHSWIPTRIYRLLRPHQVAGVKFLWLQCSNQEQPEEPKPVEDSAETGKATDADAAAKSLVACLRRGTEKATSKPSRKAPNGDSTSKPAKKPKAAKTV